MWGGRRTVISVPTQMLEHASKMSCFSDGAACAQKRFSVPGTEWGSPAATPAQNCPRLPCGGIGMPWWQWIPNTSLPRALWWGKETSQVSQFFGGMWFWAGGGHLHIYSQAGHLQLLLVAMVTCSHFEGFMLGDEVSAVLQDPTNLQGLWDLCKGTVLGMAKGNQDEAHLQCWTETSFHFIMLEMLM